MHLAAKIDPQHQLLSRYGMNKGIIAVVFSLGKHGIGFCHLLQQSQAFPVLFCLNVFF